MKKKLARELILNALGAWRENKRYVRIIRKLWRGLTQDPQKGQDPKK